MFFSISNIPEFVKNNMIRKKIWQEACPVSFEQLSLIEVSHYNFTGDIKQGQLIVCSIISPNVIEIFKELFYLKFPIQSLKLIDAYEGRDDLSMADNNSSCFNYRMIAGTDKLSMHAFGLAIDINPIQNPMVVKDGELLGIYPEEGKNFLNRDDQRPGMVEPIVDIFIKNNIDVWGGNWNNPIDYHHFQTNTTFDF